MKCGRPVHETAQVSEQEGADFLNSSPHRQQPPQSPSRAIMAPLPVLAGVFLVLGFGEFVQGMSNAPEQEVGFVLGRGLGQSLGSVLGLVISTLIAGGCVYLFYRLRRRATTFVRALLSWPVVVIATCIALLSLSLTG
jgi:hypothetical protein